MAQQTWFVGSRRWQVAQHTIDSALIGVVLDEMKNGGVHILSCDY